LVFLRIDTGRGRAGCEIGSVPNQRQTARGIKHARRARFASWTS
jgi:hypothetical protein